VVVGHSGRQAQEEGRRGAQVEGTVQLGTELCACRMCVCRRCKCVLTGNLSPPAAKTRAVPAMRMVSCCASTVRVQWSHENRTHA